MMINMPNINDVMKENNFDSAVSSLNVKTQSTGQNIIANAVPIGQKIEEENQAKEYAKYLVNETKHQDEAPANAAALLAIKQKIVVFVILLINVVSSYIIK